MARRARRAAAFAAIFPVCAPAIGARLKTIADLASACVIRDERTMIDWNAWFAPAGVPPVTLLPRRQLHGSDALPGSGDRRTWA